MCSEILRERLRIWKSFSFDSKDLRGELEDVGDLTVFYREGVLAAERRGRDGAGRGIGRVHGILLRREREQGVDLVGRLVAPRAVLGATVPMSNPLIRSVRQGIKRAHIGMGSQQKVRRPLTWGMLTEMQERVQA